MKSLLLRIALVLALVPIALAVADPLTVTLPAPTTVTTVSVTESQTSEVAVERILFDLVNEEIGVQFAGVEGRQVIRGAAYDAIRSAFLEDFQAALNAALAAGTPTPTPDVAAE